MRNRHPKYGYQHILEDGTGGTFFWTKHAIKNRVRRHGGTFIKLHSMEDIISWRKNINT